MKIVIMLLLALLALYLGIGIGTIMRFDRKISNKAKLYILLIIPIFAICGFAIWSIEMCKDLSNFHGEKLSYIRYIYKFFIKAMPSLCQDCADAIIEAFRKEERYNANKKRHKQYRNQNVSFLEKAKSIIKKGYNYALINQGV